MRVVLGCNSTGTTNIACVRKTFLSVSLVTAWTWCWLSPFFHLCTCRPERFDRSGPIPCSHQPNLLFHAAKILTKEKEPVAFCEKNLSGVSPLLASSLENTLHYTISTHKVFLKHISDIVEFGLTSIRAKCCDRVRT